MALIIFTDGSRRIVRAEVGAYMWRILNGEVVPNDKWRAASRTVRRVYLNRTSAPKSYVERYGYLFPDESPIKQARKEQTAWVETRKDLV